MSACRAVPLGRSGLFALVDEADYEAVLAYRWNAHFDPHGQRHYARRRWYEDGRQRSQFLHAFLLGVPGVDHVDLDGLNNRRANLRVATPAQNAFNTRSRAGSTSRFKGVSWCRRDRVWRAQIQVDGRNRALGGFRNEEQAALAYDLAAAELFGQFARFNFPEG